jgi:large subunit ribosomal protein L21
MYAVIEHGSHQFRVSEGDRIILDGHREQAEGAEIVFQNVLLLAGDGEPVIGAPSIPAARVIGEVVRHRRGKKIIIQKFRRRKTYRKRQGHRQYETTVAIRRIEPGA